MSCVPVPKPPALTLPGLSVTPHAIPAKKFQTGWCCATNQISTPALPVPMPPLLANPAFVSALQQATAAIMQYWDSVTNPCPREE